MQEMKLPAIYNQTGLETVEETEDLLKEIEALTKKRDESKAAFEELDEMKERLIGRLNCYDYEIAEEADRLATLLQEHEEEKLRKAKEMLDMANDEDDWNEWEDDDLETADEDEEAVMTNRELKKRCKHLFRKISKLSHPDKVGHSHLAEIFAEAVKAYENHDFARLTELHDALTKNKSKIKSVRKQGRKDLESIIAGLKKQIDQYEQDLFELISSRAYEYIQMQAQYGFQYVRNRRKEEMQTNIENLKRQLDFLGIEY